MQLHHYIAWSSNSTIEDIEPFVKGDGLQQCAKDDKGRSALFHAAECGNTEILSYLLGLPHPPRLDDTDFNGLSLMHYAVRCRCVQSIEFLLKRGCSSQIVDKTGQTALHYAVMWENLEAVKKLLSIEGNNYMSRQDNNGRTPLDLAVSIPLENGIAACLSSFKSPSRNALVAVDDASLPHGQIKTPEIWCLSPTRSIDRVSATSNSWWILAVAAALLSLCYFHILSLWNR